MAKSTKPNPGSYRTGRCAFKGCKNPQVTTYQSFDFKVLVCVEHREEWNAMCERAAKADR